MKHISISYITFTIFVAVALSLLSSQAVDVDFFDVVLEASYIVLGLLGLRIFYKLQMTLPFIGWTFISSSFIVDFLDEFEHSPLVLLVVNDYYEELSFVAGLLVLVIGLYIEVKRREEAMDQVETQVITDSLTQVYNRYKLNAMSDFLNDPANYPLGLIMTDLNGLKFVNDSFGHSAGDHLLKIAVNILKNALPENNDLVFRIGGDEVLLLVPSTDQAELDEVLNKIEFACDQTNFMEIPVSFALGSTLLKNESENFEAALRTADDRMYLDKLLNESSQGHQYIDALKQALREKSFETSEHEHRIIAVSRIMAEYIHLDKELIDSLELSAMFHDIGKIAVPESIIKKSSPLDTAEWTAIKRHPEVGSRIINGLFPSKHVEHGVLSHHEWWDGSGYPNGEKGSNIPIIARILSISDALDVMLQGRTYQAPVPLDDALTELRRCAGTQFDPELVTALDEIVITDFQRISTVI